MAGTSPSPYERLLALGVCELELVREGRMSELGGCQQTRSQLMAMLPAVAPPEARPALERCRLIQAHVEHELRLRREHMLQGLGELRRAQRAADGYAPPRTRRSQVLADA